MKRFTGMLLTLAFLLVGTFSNATPAPIVTSDEDPKIISEVADYMSIKVQLVNLQQETTIVKLEDLSGKEYYKKTIKEHNGFARKLDLNDLREGRYLLKIEQDGHKWVQVVFVDEDVIRLSKMVSKS